MKRNHKKKWFIGGTVIFACLIFISFLGMNQYSVYFYTPDEVLSSAEDFSSKDIRVGGMVKGGTVSWDAGDLNLNFVLTNMKGSEIKVFHKGTPPDLFKENSGVIVEGRYSRDKNIFSAHKLMVKHSEEYQQPGHGESMDKDLIQKSMFKNQ